MAKRNSSSKEDLLLRKYSSDLKEAMLHPVKISNKLYSKKFIDEETRDKVRREQDRSGNGAETVVEALQSYIKIRHRGKNLKKKFFRIMDILKESIPLDDVVKSIEKDYHEGKLSSDGDSEGSIEETEGKVKAKEEQIPATPDKKHTDPQGESPISSDQQFKALAIALEVYSHDMDISGTDSESAIRLMKSRIESHIRKSLEDGVNCEDIRKQLNELIMNALIPSEIIDWCFEKLEEPSDGLKPSEVVDGTVCDSPPLFSKDTVYHASICSSIVSTVAPHVFLSVQELEEKLKEYGHSFDEISLSVTNKKNAKILIAQQGSIFYIAFAMYKDEDGPEDFLKQLSYIPLRYFTELLNQGKRLVFTGFSSGGLLARCIFMKLWNLPFFSAEILSYSLTCIMFGPLLQGNSQKFCDDCPDAFPYLHSFFLKDDFVPKIRFINEIMGFGLQHDTVEQQLEFSKLVLPRYLRLVSSSREVLGNQFGSSYFIQENRQSTYWEQMERPEIEIASYLFDRLEEHNFKQHDMCVYQLKVLRGYLDKKPQYEMPLKKPKGSIKEVQSIKPSISKVEIHHQKHPNGKETSFVFEGDSLWFCTQIIVDINGKRLEIPISAQDVSQKQIQYNHGLDDCFDTGELDYLDVVIQSHFSEPVTHTIPVTFKEPDPISFRQSQLAKQTPSQIIQLAFLSALLELSPEAQKSKRTCPSKRFQLIVNFLQEAARIVPMESIFFAIAGCSSSRTAQKCTESVLASHSSFPCSKLMADGCFRAAYRLRDTFSLRRMHVTPPPFSSNVAYRYVESSAYALQTQIPFFPDTQAFYSVGNTPKRKVKQNPSVNTHHTQTEKRPTKKKVSTVAVPLHQHLLHPSHSFALSERLLCIAERISQSGNSKLICGRNISEAYPISSDMHNKGLTPLPVILREAREELAKLSDEHKDSDQSVGAIATGNNKMLETVNTLIENDLDPCVAMLGGFMEQQIRIPLVNNAKDTAEAFASADTAGAVGVWALFALQRKDILNILSSRRQQMLVIQITKFIQGVLKNNERKDLDEDLSSYDAKLQFLLQGMNKTVTCSSHYISYSLERELVGLCEQFNITTKTKVAAVISNWNTNFSTTALALVPVSHRPLLACWMIWALNIYRLREGLAKYTTVGVIGLVNCGKSTLVKEVFKMETVTGTTQGARTTVPFIYNMDDSVEGLSIIDFPGVDDRDESIKGLAKLLVGLAQVIIFVCGQEFHTASAREWMEIFQNELSSVPVLVCLTHADDIYENCKEEIVPVCPPGMVEEMKRNFQRELEVQSKSWKLSAIHSNCTVKFCSLLQRRHSPLNSPEGRDSMRKVGIYTPEDIGQWVQGVIRNNLQQPDLAERLDKFFPKSKPL